MDNTNVKRTCCFTGHRPEKLDIGENEVKELLLKSIYCAMAEGYDTFISGMADGTDIWAAETVIGLKKNSFNISLICAMPYPNFRIGKKDADNHLRNYILENSDYRVNVRNHYYSGCFQVRNKWMVDNSNLVIAVYTGIASGTKNTIEYATKQGRNVINVLNRKNAE